MEKEQLELKHKKKRRTYGAHLTSSKIFLNHIFPEIKDKLYDFIWVDLYAGEGNLILPILKHIPVGQRANFFEKHIFLYDILPEMREKCIKNAINYKIPLEIAQKNIISRNNLESFPKVLKKSALSIYHITNPPYLYLGYIRKHTETQDYLKYFRNKNEGYQDLYQIAMMNDLRNDIEHLVYIIPSNFLFGASVSNKFRKDFLKYYKILKIIIFEIQVFEFTGTNICIGFFERKATPKDEKQSFIGVKVKKNNLVLERKYNLIPRYKYRAGSEFYKFIESYKTVNSLNVNYYLLKKEVQKNKGKNEINVIDANNYKNGEYQKIIIKINDTLKKKIKKNILFARTVDTGTKKGRVGLELIKKQFGVNGIYVSGNTYRTHPIHIFLEPELLIQDQILLKDYTNYILDHFRKKLDSEFLTTYKYSSAKYTRKYLGLTQLRGLIETFPYNLDKLQKNNLISYIRNNQIEKIVKLLQNRKKK